jgi:mono/diheme cytochrome c family protein
MPKFRLPEGLRQFVRQKKLPEKRDMNRLGPIFILLAGAAVLVLSASCSATAAPAATSAPTTAPATATQPPAATAAPTSSGPVTLVSYLPPGPGRQLLLDNCGSCHNPGCAVIGQRTADHWNRVKADHVSRVSGMSDADYNTLFDYLATNFNDSKPEPPLPPQLKQQATCTTGF